MPQVEINREKCKGCKLCVEMCPSQCLFMSKDINSKGYFYSQTKRHPRCIGCKICAIVCPDVAIKITIEGMTYKYFDY